MPDVKPVERTWDRRRMGRRHRKAPQGWGHAGGGTEENVTAYTGMGDLASDRYNVALGVNLITSRKLCRLRQQLHWRLRHQLQRSTRPVHLRKCRLRHAV